MQVCVYIGRVCLNYQPTQNTTRTANHLPTAHRLLEESARVQQIDACRAGAVGGGVVSYVTVVAIVVAQGSGLDLPQSGLHWRVD